MRSRKAGRNGYETGKLSEGGGALGAQTQFSAVEDASGIQVDPSALLISCFAFIVSVMAAHIVAKFVAK